MPNLPISQLPTSTTLSDSYLIPIVSGSTTSKATLGAIKAYNRNQSYFSTTYSISGSANTELLMTVNTSGSTNTGISVISGSRFTVETSGIYDLQFSAQLDRVAGSGVRTVSIWLKITGSNVADSCTDVVMSGGALASATVAAWNYFLPLNAGEYCELAWSTPDANLHITATGSRSNPTRPAVPSLIVTMNQISPL
jgi:hypothetical protein